MKNSGIPWIGEIPKDWKCSSLKYFIDCLDGKRVPLDAGSRIKVTMSFGVEALNRDRDLAENIKRADDKLYIAKSSGRNRVVKQSGD